MFRNRMFLSAMIIVTVSALVIGGTVAWFYGTNDGSATVSTATIAIGETQNFPLLFTNMLPNETVTKDFWVKNTGTRAADIYFHMIGDTGDDNFCAPVNAGIIVTIPGWWSGSICDLYMGQGSSVIPKIADDVAAGAWVNLTVQVTLPGAADNIFQGKTNTDVVHLVAVQYDGPAPTPETTGFGGGMYAVGWPGPNEPNY
jgi:hypothetical protein